MSPVRVCMRVNNVFTHDARVRREAECLAEAGYDVTVVADLRGEHPASEELGPVHVRRIAKTSRVPYWSIIRPLIAERADVYHGHDIDSLLPALAAARLGGRGAKVVYDSHELWSGHASDKVHAKRQQLVRIEGAMLKRADALITASPAYTEEMERRYEFRGITATLLNVPRWFSDEELGPHWTKRDATEGVTIASVGVFQQGRGAIPLIEALAHLPEHYRVDLVGPIPQPDYEARMRAAAEPFGSRVVFSGHIPAAQVVPRLAESHLSAVLIEPHSLSYRLTSPNKLYDAMMAGTPSLAADLPVIGGVTKREHTGIVCDVADPRDIARAALEATERAAELRANARRAAERYNWDAEKAVLLGVYERLTGGAEGRS